MSRLKDLHALIGILAAALLLAGFCIPVYQGFLWLREGVWHPFQTGLAVQYFTADAGAFWNWVYQPKEWIGLSRIVLFILHIPLSIFLIVTGLLLAMFNGDGTG